MTEVGTVRRIKRGGKSHRYIYAFNRETFKFSYIRYHITDDLYDKKYVLDPKIVEGYKREVYTNKARALRENILGVIETRTSSDYDKAGLLEEVKDKLYSMTDEQIHQFSKDNNNLLREYFFYEQTIKENGTTHTVVNRDVGTKDMDASTQVVLESLGINMENYYIKRQNRYHQQRMEHLKEKFLKKVELNNEE